MLLEKKEEKDAMINDIKQYRQKLSAQLLSGQKLVKSQWRTILLVGGAAMIAGTAIALLVGSKTQRKTFIHGSNGQENMGEEPSVMALVKRNIADMIAAVLKEKLVEWLEVFLEKRKASTKVKEE